MTCCILFGQITATLHDLGPQKVAQEGKSAYFREIEVGEILCLIWPDFVDSVFGGWLSWVFW